jgi:hypothetical protein
MVRGRNDPAISSFMPNPDGGCCGIEAESDVREGAPTTIMWA